MNIRRAKPTDAYGIAHVQVTTWRAAYSDFMSESAFENMTLNKRTIRWGEILLNPLGPTFVAVDDDEVVGFVSGAGNRDGLADEILEIYACYVLPGFWGTGVGRSLISHSMEHYFSDAAAVTLWVLSENSRAIRFYEKCGFVADGAEKEITFGDDTLPELRMRRANRS